MMYLSTSDNITFISCTRCKKQFMRIIFIFTSLVFTLSNVFGQTDLKNAPNSKYVSSSKTETFLISTKPITNREYIIYLLWISNVYGTDYPETLIEAIPGTSDSRKAILESDLFETKPFEAILKYSPEFIWQYVFNPNYIDFPVIGINQLQASKFCKWLSDRYNENKLVQHGYFNPSSFQLNEDCFVTESYLAEQYFGSRIKQETVVWNDRLLVPTFRLPTKSELDLAFKSNSINKEIKSYPYDSTSFINYWHQLYLNVSSDFMSLKFFMNNIEWIETPKVEWIKNQTIIDELLLDKGSHSQDVSLIDIYKLNGQKELKLADFIGLEGPEKDSLGLMPFIIIGENSQKQPLIVENYKVLPEGNVDNKFYIFRFVCNIKPGQFKP